jgi:ribonuclease HII
MAPDFHFETGLANEGFKRIAGVDEAGRGPLAGPVVAAAVILDPLRLAELKGLDDSKKVSPARRERLYEKIIEVALAFGLGQASEGEVDELNVLQAALLAMRRALSKLQPCPDIALVDGPFGAGGEFQCRPVIGGDGKSLSIAAASILAKVTRDRLMRVYHQDFPQYGFDRHKGYGTARHRAALEQWGPCAIHRRTFLSRIALPPLSEAAHAGE